MPAHCHHGSWQGGGGRHTPEPDLATRSRAAGGTAAWGTQEEARLTGRSFDELFEDLVVGISFHKTGQMPAREFSTWDFVSATEIFTAPPVLTPPGRYPWPVTGDDTSPNAPFVTATFAGPMGPSGMRFHDFLSSGVGAGLQILATGAAAGRIIVSRIN